MISTTTRLARTGFVLAIAAAGLAGRADRASGQQSFDPYRPDSAQYQAYTFPIVPNNLSLPGAAREAAEYNVPNGVSRFNTFERYLSDNDFGSSTRRPASGAGVPYYESYRQNTTADDRSYAPTRDADRRIAEYEAKLRRDESRRDRLSRDYIREKDPAKKAAIAREYRALTKPVDPRSLPYYAPRPTEARRAPGTMLPAARRSAAEDLAGEAPADPKDPKDKPAAPASRPATPRQGRPEDLLPESRPLLPSETLDREERLRRRARQAPARTPAATPPAATPTTVPDPSATPR